jgi:hypothetical protein
VYEGGTATFSVVAAGNPTPTIQWQARAPGQSQWATLANTMPFNSSPYTGVQTPTLTVTNAPRALDGTLYRAVVTNDFGVAASQAATLSVDYELRIATHPASHSIVVGQSTAFSVTATVTIPTSYQWQTRSSSAAPWVDVASDGTHAGDDTAVLTVANAPVGLNRREYRVVLTSATGTATSQVATLLVAGPLVVSPSTLRFAATKTGTSAALTHVTAPQTLRISSLGDTPAWTASVDQPWLQLSTSAGIGAGSMTISIVSPNTVTGEATATVTITPVPSGLAPFTVSVSLAVTTVGSTTAPFGQVDTPAQGTTGVTGALGLTGWVLDDVGVTSVKVYRNRVNLEGNVHLLGYELVYVGDAVFVAGARPDVEAAFPSVPQAHRAGWGFQVLTNMLPRVGGAAYGGQGTFTWYVIATDAEGHTTLLGRTQSDSTPTTVTIDNDQLARPFGTLDTPSPGATVSGLVANFGWVLTPDTDTVADSSDILLPVDGSTITVYVDGWPVSQVTYNQCRASWGSGYCRDDISNIFGNATPTPMVSSRFANPTRFRNLDSGRGAVGSFVLDTRTLANGMHSIAWGVTDSAGRGEGIGGRDVFVLNSGADAVSGDVEVPETLTPDEFRAPQVSLRAAARPVPEVVGRSGFSLSTPMTEMLAGADGERFVRIPQAGRLELHLGGAVDRGYLVANGTMQDLPPGSRLEATTGRFTWAPSLAYLGKYRLVFDRQGQSLPVTVTILPDRPRDGNEAEIRMHIDRPGEGELVGGALRIDGWALDPEAFTGSGIGAIHVWARRLDQPTLGLSFVGAAGLGVDRPDVGQAFGATHIRAGFQLSATLDPGRYEVTVYAWNQRTTRWEDARSVTITVRR